MQFTFWSLSVTTCSAANWPGCINGFFSQSVVQEKDANNPLLKDEYDDGNTQRDRALTHLIQNLAHCFCKVCLSTATPLAYWCAGKVTGLTFLPLTCRVKTQITTDNSEVTVVTGVSLVSTVPVNASLCGAECRLPGGQLLCVRQGLSLSGETGSRRDRRINRGDVPVILMSVQPEPLVFSRPTSI